MRTLIASTLAAVLGCRGGDPPPPPPDPVVTVPMVACKLGPVPQAARIASRDFGTSPGWFYGQQIFEYLRPSSETTPDGARHLNANASGGTSSVGRNGAALTLSLPANRSLPSDSLLRFGPPPAFGFRAPAPGNYRIAVVACPITGAYAPWLELQLLRAAPGADPVALGTVEAVMWRDAEVRPELQILWSANPIELGIPLAREIETELRTDDVVSLVATGTGGEKPSAANELALAVDLAFWPR